MTIQATPAKLKTGAWGARVAGTPVQVGDHITVTSQAGKTWSATVLQVVWQGSGVTLVATGNVGPAHQATGRCKGCGGAIRDAGHHRAMGGYCGSCAFDEFDM